MKKAARVSGEDMKAVRTKLGLSPKEFAAALGYAGKGTSLDCHIRRYECGARVIPPWIGRLVIMFDTYGVPEIFRPAGSRK